MEAGVNRVIMAQHITPDSSASVAMYKIHELEGMVARLPTQTKRAHEMDKFQQHSTPPQFAFAAAWAANMTLGEIVLELSAGIGWLTIYAKLAGAQIPINEL